jgi:hypothetical protein
MLFMLLFCTSMHLSCILTNMQTQFFQHKNF